MLDPTFMLQGPYKYKGQIYDYLGTIQMKHPTTRKWVEAVMYRNWGPIARTYVREKSEFMQKFDKAF